MFKRVVFRMAPFVVAGFSILWFSCNKSSTAKPGGSGANASSAYAGSYVINEIFQGGTEAGKNLLSRVQV